MKSFDVPSPGAIMRSLKSSGVQVDAVLDVGVRENTPFLMNQFKDKKQYLFEPMREWHDSIRREYKDHDYELLPVACGSEPGVIEFRASFKDNSLSLPSHGAISGYMPREQSSHQYDVDMIRLDDFVSERNLNGPFLLKVDVDGADLEVLKGASETLKLCSVVVLEMIPKTFGAISSFMSGNGFYMYTFSGAVFGGTPFELERSQAGTALLHCDCVFLPERRFKDPAFRPAY